MITGNVLGANTGLDRHKEGQGRQPIGLMPFMEMLLMIDLHMGGEDK
jgi:hypothetical protein